MSDFLNQTSLGGGRALQNSEPPPIVEFDDTEVVFERHLHFAAPDIVSAGAGAYIKNTSDGTTYYLGASTYGVPGAGDFGAMPRAGLGGLTLGIFTDFRTQILPQLKIGGVQFIPRAGACAGFWCASPESAGLMQPEVIFLTTGLGLASSILFGALSIAEIDDAEAWFLGQTNEVASNLIPLTQVADMLSVLRVPLGAGPDAQGIITRAELSSYHRSLERLISFNARVDAERRVREALAIPREPFVEAELRNILDHVIVKQNSSGIPRPGSIEKNIRAAVESVEKFFDDYSLWLTLGMGAIPSDAEIDSFMGKALYLTNKLSFNAEEVDEDGDPVFKIRSSAPFEIDDPELATRFIEAAAAIYRTLASRASGLVAHIAQKTGDLLLELLRSADELALAEEKDPASANLMEAEAKFAWHVNWIGNMENTYGNRSLYHRMRHIRWIVGESAAVKRAEELDRRILAIDPDGPSGELRETLPFMLYSNVSPAERYEFFAPHIEALNKTLEIATEDFPGEYGDITLIFDRERAGRWSERREIVDAFFHYAMAIKSHGDSSATDESANAIRRENERRLVKLIEENPAEARREWWAYCSNPKAHLGKGLRSRMVKRLEHTETRLGALDTSELNELINESGLSPAVAAHMRTIVDELSSRIETMRSEIQGLKRKARRFRDGNFRSEEHLFYEVDGDLKEVARVAIEAWEQGVLFSFRALADEAKETGLIADEDFENKIKEWDNSLSAVSSQLVKCLLHFDRFNTKRTGAFFMERFIRKAGIDLRTNTGDPFKSETITLSDS